MRGFAPIVLDFARFGRRLDTIVKLGGALQIEPCRLLTGLAWELDPPKEESR